MTNILWQGFDPRRVPLVPTAVDWSHPLALGLEHCVLFGRAENVAQPGYPPTFAGATIVVGPTGPAVLTAGTSSSYVTIPGRAGASGAPFTAAVLFRPVSYLADYTTVVDKGADSATRECSVFVDATGALDYFNVTSASGGSMAAGGGPYLLVATYDGTNAYFYQDGNFLSSAAQGAITLTAANPWYFGFNFTGGGVDTNAEYVAFQKWSRALPASDVAWLAAETFGMLRPLARRAHSPPAGGVSLTLTGLAATSAIGAPAAADKVAIAGLAATTVLGAPGTPDTLPLAGLSATSSLGAPSIAETVSLPVLAATAALGVPSPGDRLALSGLTAAVALGTPAEADTIAVGALAAVSALGTPAETDTITIPALSAVTAYGAPSVATSGNVTVALGALAATTSLAAPGPADGVPLAGLSGTTAFVGLPTASAIVLPALAATTAFGTVTASTGGATVALPNVSARFSLGLLSVSIISGAPDFLWSAIVPAENLCVAVPPENLSAIVPAEQDSALIPPG